MFKMVVNDDNFFKGLVIGMNVFITVVDIYCYQF